MSPKMLYEEFVAKAVVEALEPASQMDFQEVQSQGEHDFNLVYDDGHVAALEVTTSADEAGLLTLDAIRKKGSIPTKLCKWGWMVHPEPNARINEITRLGDEYLAEVEAEGLGTFFAPMDRSSPSVARIWKDLGIEHGNVMPTPGIAILPPIVGGPYGVSSFVQAFEAEASKGDNRRKLGSAGTVERHLFVFVHTLNLAARLPLITKDPPTERIVLPPEMTHAWAAAEGLTPGDFGVWRVRSGEAWRNCGPIALRPEDVD